MKRYTLITSIIAGAVLVSFLIVEWLGVPLLVDPTDTLNTGGWIAVVVGGGLLILDVFIPIPSSVIMIAHGAIFGWLGGFVLSLVASVIGAMIGWYVGHRSLPLMRRFVSETDQERANALFQQYGLLAIIISRLLPIVAETVAVISGTTDYGWRKVLLATTIGSIPPALIYAIAGASTTDFASGAFVAIGVMVLAAASWLVGRKLIDRTAREQAPIS